MAGNLEQNRGIDLGQSVKKTDSFPSGKEYKKIQEQTKQKVEILEAFLVPHPRHKRVTF